MQVQLYSKLSDTRIARNGIITLYAGDYLEAPIFLNVGDTLYPVRYTLKEGEKIYIGIMEPKQDFKHAIVRKMLTIEDLNEDGDAVLKLNTEDTEYLMPGIYYYEIKFVTVKDEVERIETIVPKTKFIILG